MFFVSMWVFVTQSVFFLMKWLSRIPGRIYLLLAVVIFAAANSVTRKLVDLGAQHLIDGRNPLSFCNVLFVGNLAALLALVLIYNRRLVPPELRTLSRRNWIGIGTVAILSGAIAPMLIFLALERTSVNNVILLGRIEPPVVLLLSIVVLRERVHRWVILGDAIAFVGVVLTVSLQTPDQPMITMGGLSLDQGEVMVLAGAIAAALATVISKISLQQVALGFFTTFRTVVGTVVFFGIVIYLFGLEHFVDVLSPFVWQWMLLYGAVIVVGGQLCWFRGLQSTTAAEVSLASSFNPVAGILAAYLILGEVPNLAQYVGGAVIMLGIGINQRGIRAQAQSLPPVERSLSLQTESAQTAEAGVGFKGI